MHTKRISEMKHLINCAKSQIAHLGWPLVALRRWWLPPMGHRWPTHHTGGVLSGKVSTVSETTNVFIPLVESITPKLGVSGRCAMPWEIWEIPGQYKFPWQFPDLEKKKFPLTFPWCMASLKNVTVRFESCFSNQIIYNIKTTIFVPDSFKGCLLL